MNTNELRHEQKIEAIKRMNALNLMDDVITEFEQDNTLYRSEYGGILYWLTDDQKAMASAFEQKHNTTVYQIICNETEFGSLISLLYVSAHMDEWGYDNEDIKDNIAVAYVLNLDAPECSEFGSIGIKPRIGGLVRTY